MDPDFKMRRRIAALLQRLPAWRGDGQYHLSRALFLRGMGAVYAVAFVSLGVQVEGLVGSGGILPACEFVEAVQQNLGPWGWLRVPTLLWLYCSDAVLVGLCFGGAAVALAVFAGCAHTLLLMALWAIYLSLTVVCRDFLSFQWDALLLEAGFLAWLWAPWQWRPAWQWSGEPSNTVVYLLRFLIFRLMFSSGLVKVLSGDPTWSGLDALAYHFETQPLPNPLAWYAHGLPAWIQAVGVGSTLFIELVLPWGIWAGRRPRRWAAAGFVLLQGAIAATGNYGFFNLLTAILCLPLLDDSLWRRIWSRAEVPAARAGWPKGCVWGAAAMLWALGGMVLLQTVHRDLVWPQPFLQVQQALRPFRLVNGYGLFAVMTTSRREILVQGSQDGSQWREYRFIYKPGSASKRPTFAGLHMPRLDWQMWFAALGPYQRQSWFLPFMGRLLAAEPQVLELMAEAPFAEGRPRYVRALIAPYNFTKDGAISQGGIWWRVGPQQEYCPVLSLRR
jgi:lipase maturation factor 1